MPLRTSTVTDGYTLACAGLLTKMKGKQPMREVVLYPGEDGFWIVECPSLPGCISQGKSREEAVANIKEAIEGYIEALCEDNLPVP